MDDATIEIREPDVPARRMRITAPTEVGRECDGVLLTDPMASRRHLLLTPGPAGLRLEDLGSSNGTKVNGTRVTGPVEVREGDVIAVGVGGTAIEVVTVGSDAIEPEPAEPAEPPEVPDAASEPVPDAVGGRPELAALESIEVGGCAVRFRAGTAGATAAKGFASACATARSRLAGIGSEPWGTTVQLCLVDPFPDPDRPGEVMTGGTIVDADRAEVWMVVTAESPPEPPERPLALLFGAVLPAADILRPLLEGYAFHVAGLGDPDEHLRGVELPPLGGVDVDADLAAAMKLSFVRYLLGLAGPDGFRQLLAAGPGRLGTVAEEIYGSTLAGLEEAWRQSLAGRAPMMRTRQFLGLALRYIRPHLRREAEMAVYMVLGLAFTMVFPFVFRNLIDRAIPSGRFGQVAELLGLLGVAFAISLLADLRRAYLAAYVSGSIVRELRVEMFDKLQRLGAGWFGAHQQGDVLSRLFSDVSALETGLSGTLRNGLFQLLSLVVSSVVLLVLNPLLGVIVLFGAPLVGLVYRTMSAGAQQRSIAVQEQLSSLLALSAENYGAQPVVKAFALEAREKLRFGRASDRLFLAERRLSLFGGLFGLSVNMIVTALRIGVLALGAWLILHGHLTIGGLVAFMSLMGEALSPVTVLTGIGQQIQASTGALTRINVILDAEPDVVDDEAAAPLAPLAREIRLAGVGFSYSPERRTLDQLDVTIPRGSRVAFVGPTGAGKSSALQLLMRFYDPDEGAVLFDDRDVRDAPVESLRAQLGVVFQDTFLFDTTIRENIAMGRPGATDQEVEDAARAAEVHDFIIGLPRSYDTLVGERGSRLSGGQRQRIAIARALVRDPAVILLDEATSALDPRTERLINDTLERVASGRTTIAVTHRLTSITDFDRIFVLVEGRLAEAGTHDELVARAGVYASLWSEQTGAAVMAAAAPFDLHGALARVPLFADLDPAGHDDVAARLVSADLAAGAVLAEGGGQLAIVRRGRARVLVPGLDGQWTTLAELRPGDSFGLAALLGQQRGAVLRAEEPVVLLLLADEALAALATKYPSVATALEGRVRPAVAPAGGQRLSRLTMGQASVQERPGLARPSAPPAPTGDDVRRFSGSFRAVR